MNKNLMWKLLQVGVVVGLSALLSPDATAECKVVGPCCSAETSCPANNPSCECRYICDPPNSGGRSTMGCECWCEGAASPAFFPIDGDGAFIRGFNGESGPAPIQAGWDGELLSVRWDKGAKLHNVLRTIALQLPAWEIKITWDKVAVLGCATINGDPGTVLRRLGELEGVDFLVDREERVAWFHVGAGK